MRNLFAPWARNLNRLLNWIQIISIMVGIVERDWRFAIFPILAVIIIKIVLWFHWTRGFLKAVMSGKVNEDDVISAISNK